MFVETPFDIDIAGAATTAATDRLMTDWGSVAGGSG